MTKILVTGSSGYIGSNLCNQLINNGNTVIPWDLKNNKDINKLNYILLSNLKPDCIIHLAALPGIADCETNKEETIRTNISSSYTLINAADNLNIPLIFASSIAAKNPQSSMYAMSKYIIEQYINNLNIEKIKNDKCPCLLALRFSNVFGGLNFLEKKQTVISNFVNNLNNKQKCIISGDGNQTRNFIHVDEICRLIISLFENFSSKIESQINSNKPAEIGSTNSYTILEIFKKILNYKYPNITKHQENEAFILNNSLNPGIQQSTCDISFLNNIEFFPDDLLDTYFKSLWK